jgi:hypothetical protein
MTVPSQTATLIPRMIEQAAQSQGIRLQHNETGLQEVRDPFSEKITQTRSL